MKKLVRGALTLWCVICGLVVPPALLGVVLAQSMGVLDLHPVVDRLQGTSASTEAEADGVGIVPVSADLDALDADPMPLEAYGWRRKLESLDDRVAAETLELAAREDAVQAREVAQAEVARSLADFLAELFEVPVSPESVIEEPDRWRERLLARVDAEAQRPRLLKLLQTVEKDALAEILATPGASNGIDEYTVTRLVEELPPARAGEVITELGRRDPALAARIIERLERSTGKTPSPSSPAEGDSTP